jgi:hypothetical protein
MHKAANRSACYYLIRHCVVPNDEISSAHLERLYQHDGHYPAISSSGEAGGIFYRHDAGWRCCCHRHHRGSGRTLDGALLNLSGNH